MLANLKQIREHIQQRGLGITIYEMKKLCADYHQNKALSDIESVDNDYQLIIRFFAGGFDDPERENLYNKLELRLYNILLTMLIDGNADQNPTFKQCRINALSMPFEYESIEETLSRYDQELTLASLDVNADEKQKNIHQRLLRYRIHLFNFIYTSTPWSLNESEIMKKVLLSPLVDVIDQQIILGAMLMAQRMVFDVWKFKTLCDVAAKTESLHVRERALVAVALALPDDIDRQMNKKFIDSAIDHLLDVDGICQEFVDLQAQLILCMDTTKAEKTIKDEILPTLMKNSQQMMPDKLSDKDKLDSLLNPDKEEKQMEEVEASINKMRNMHKSGADIFFSSFSQAKRFSFFYTMMNWFCPFYFEHPQVATADFQGMHLTVLEKITAGEKFCNSDKYSFILCLAHVIHQLPKDLLNMMKNGEVGLIFEGMHDDDKAFIRRSYLNDLYRFFNLYPDKNSFRNPFASEESVCFFLNPLFVDEFHDTPFALRVSRQLLKHDHYKALGAMLSKYALRSDIEWLKLLALNAEHEKNYDDALEFFNMAHKKAPGNKLLLNRTAQAAFLAECYPDARDFYQEYLDMTTEDDDTDVEEYRIALCDFMMRDYENGMKRLFRLSYNDPENIVYRKALAWGYMLEKKYLEALHIYEEFDEQEFQRLDFVRKAMAQWMNHKNADAAMTLRRLYEIFVLPNTDNHDDNIIDMVFKQLLELGVLNKYMTEAYILIDLALKDKLN